VVLHLLAVPAHTDAEDYSSSRYEIQARDFLGRNDRVSLDYQGYPRAEQQAFRCSGSGGEGDEGGQGSGSTCAAALRRGAKGTFG
jgi:hypothetical protein